MAIQNNNVLNVKFLRSKDTFETRELAVNSLKTQLGSMTATQDGTAILARYGTGNDVKTIIGWVYFKDENKSITIQDAEGSEGEIKKYIEGLLGSGVTSANTVTSQLEALSGGTYSTSGSNSGDTSISGAKKYAYDLLGTLDSTDAAVSGNYVTEVNQTDGKIRVSRTELPSLSVVSGDGEVIVSVSEDKGQLAATKSLIKDVKLTSYSKDANKTGDFEATDDIEDIFSKIENNIDALESGLTLSAKDKSVVVDKQNSGTTVGVNIKADEKVIKLGENGIYTNISISSITGTDLSNLGANVKEAYKLVDSDGGKLGEAIKIYKDSSISKIYLGYPEDTVDAGTGVITSGTTGESQSLNYVYHNENGAYEMVHVDVSKFLAESEFASGVTAEANGVVHGVVDSTSEKGSNDASFLTVGANGFKINGIKDEINSKINALDATISGKTSGNHISITIEEVDGKLVQSGLTIEETDIASQTLLNELSGKTITSITSTNGSITATPSNEAGNKTVNIETDASKIKMSGFSSNSIFSGISSSSSITEAFGEVEDVIESNERVTSSALNDLNTRINNLSGDSISGITVNGNNVTVTNNVAPLSITAATGAITSATTAIDIATGTNGSITIGLGVIDCGEY